MFKGQTPNSFCPCQWGDEDLQNSALSQLLPKVERQLCGGCYGHPKEKQNYWRTLLLNNNDQLFRGIIWGLYTFMTWSGHLSPFIWIMPYISQQFVEISMQKGPRNNCFPNLTVPPWVPVGCIHLAFPILQWKWTFLIGQGGYLIRIFFSFLPTGSNINTDSTNWSFNSAIHQKSNHSQSSFINATIDLWDILNCNIVNWF